MNRWTKGWLFLCVVCLCVDTATIAMMFFVGSAPTTVAQMGGFGVFSALTCFMVAVLGVFFD